MPSKQNICITFVQCWNVKGFGPTLYKCYTNVLCSPIILELFHIPTPALIMVVFSDVMNNFNMVNWPPSWPWPLKVNFLQFQGTYNFSGFDVK